METNKIYLVLSNNQSWYSKGAFEKEMNTINTKSHIIKFNMQKFEEAYSLKKEYILAEVDNTDVNRKWLLHILKDFKSLNIATTLKTSDEICLLTKPLPIIFSNTILQPNTENENDTHFLLTENNNTLFKYSIVLNNNQFWLKRNELNEILRDELKTIESLDLYQNKEFEYSNIVLEKPFVLFSSNDEQLIKNLALNLLRKKVVLKLYEGYQHSVYTEPYKKRIRYRDQIIRKAKDIFNIETNNSNKNNVANNLANPLTFEKLLTIDSFFENRIIGQQQAIDEIKTQLISQFYEQSDEKERKGPLGVFLFVGPTGVGKTELCKVLSEFLYNNQQINRIDMSEYQDESAVFKLIGASHGYQDSEYGGSLTNALDNNPNAIILFDELEKAHSSLFKLFLTMFDEGYFTSGKNKKYDIKNNLIILTSNIGASNINILSNKQTSVQLKEEVINFFKNKLGAPEILGRIPNDNIIVFNAITKFEDQTKILDIEFNKFINNYKKKTVNLIFDKSNVYTEILSNIDINLGARNIVNEFDQFTKKFQLALYKNQIKPEDMKNITIEFSYLNKEVNLKIVR